VTKPSSNERRAFQKGFAIGCEIERELSALDKAKFKTQKIYLWKHIHRLEKLHLPKNKEPLTIADQSMPNA
jgi:hypothetical protein